MQIRQSAFHPLRSVVQDQALEAVEEDQAVTGPFDECDRGRSQVRKALRIDSPRDLMEGRHPEHGAAIGRPFGWPVCDPEVRAAGGRCGMEKRDSCIGGPQGHVAEAALQARDDGFSPLMQCRRALRASALADLNPAVEFARGRTTAFTEV